MRGKSKEFFAKYRFAIAFCYVPIYFLWFTLVEKRTNVEFTYMHCRVDDMIPFCEYFIIPYLMWFGYVALGVVFLAFQTRFPKDFNRCVIALMTGMTVFLIVSTVWPNAQSMRPESFARDNMFTRLIAGLYSTDTSTNVFPSIHVYNSIVIHVALCKCHALRGKSVGKRIVKALSLLLCVSICISTMTLKQHSFLDFCGAVVMYGVVYLIVYRPTGAYLYLVRQIRQRRNEIEVRE